MISLLLDNGASISAQSSAGGTPLYCAVSNNQIEILRLLLSRIDPHDPVPALEAPLNNAYTPLHEAAQTLNVTATKLLAAGADARARSAYPNQTALHLVARKCTRTLPKHAVQAIEVMRLLIEAGCPVDASTRWVKRRCTWQPPHSSR